MTVKIVTDSSADLPSELVKELGITVVPLYLRFGEEVFRDRVDISEDEFYQRLQRDPVHPSTTQPTPQDFVNVYQELSKEADGIVSIHISSKLSGTCNSAIQARDMVGEKCPIEVIDSEKVAMGLGLIVIAAANANREGAKLDDLVKLVGSAMPRSHLMVYFDTLKYLSKGGRIGKAQGLLGSMLSIKPILTVKDGEMAPVTRLRSQAAGVEYLYNFMTSFPHIDELAVEHTTLPDEADKLVERLSVSFPEKRIYRSTVSPVMGVYAGPNAIAVTVLESEGRG